ncbi:DUF4221 family protein [Cyclobacterium qasimii]|uniref:DUF4221 domain-containing protein n=2 Tax=Cyclobacterium qasimii TaxID=1350429 RepID=S7VN03_9BACT|nr:DUF4221 family protein [Cyclobacterium qasimii]EPR71575.1 hypothetical protein ADICYQ_0243 [Cyclobacterium qasimii M12-11B]GEO20281.1 hypothetical protein CQA01_08150 [Cyclobacterium qasimii]
MKNYAILVSLIVLFSCSENKTISEDIGEFNLSQDTVLIDPKGSIINLKYGLNSPGPTKDGEFLYHYTYGETKLDKINIKSLELEKTIQFEKEGPNGIGNYIAGFAATAEDQLMIWSYGLNAIFDENGKKIKDLNLEKIAIEVSGSEIFPIKLMLHPTDPNKVFGLYVKWEDNQYFILKFDVENESFEKILLPETEKLDEYQMKIEIDGNPAGGFGPIPFPTLNQNKIIMTNDAFNEAYVFDINLDSLYLKSWTSQLTANQNEYKLPKTVDMVQRDEHTRKYYESINFSTPKWDPVSRRYIRLSYKIIYGEDLDENGQHEETGAEVFLTVLDENLNFVKETFLDQYRKKPRNHFFKDNKIWFYENIDDELGFVRITVD